MPPKQKWKEKQHGKKKENMSMVSIIFLLIVIIDLYEDNTQLDLNNYATKGYNYSTEAGMV